jgi:CDGSH-type Zn-finger protein
MQEPIIAQKSPVEVQVEAGQTYWWCSCGHSRNQPWCDGSHAGTGLAPLEYHATRDRSLFLCACKRTAKGPYCDGTHNGL